MRGSVLTLSLVVVFISKVALRNRFWLESYLTETLTISFLIGNLV